MTTRYPCALTIAGSDSGGGAGIQADLKTFSALGVYGASVITAITAQNTVGVRAVAGVSPQMVVSQLEAVLDDLPIAAIKIGMLSSVEIVRAVSETLRRYRVSTVVLDPVMLAKSGDPLLHSDAVLTLVNELFPLATVITPNLPEAAHLLGMPEISDTLEAANKLLHFGSRAVLIKGGHAGGDEVEDLLQLADEETPYRYRHPRLSTRHTHGTGCSLSSAIAAGLAQGLSMPAAVDAAVHWLHGAIAHAWPLGAGHGPVHHFWQYWPAQVPEKT